MQKTLRERNGGIFTREELLISMVQGIVIAAGAMILYCYFMNSGASPVQTKTIVYTTLILRMYFSPLLIVSLLKQFITPPV